MVDYSRLDGIGDTSSDEEPPAQHIPAALAGPQQQGRTQAPPDGVLEDLEDYFERLDNRRAALEAGGEPFASDAASVERFSEEDFALLQHSSATATGAECPICLAVFEPAENLVTLPCAAAHCFHRECAHGWFSRNVTCPLCRVDVRRLVRANS